MQYISKKPSIYLFRYIIGVGLFLIIILCSARADNVTTSPQEALDAEYLQYVKATLTFIAVDAHTTLEKIERGDSFLLYTGRLTCAWCRKLVPSLYDAAASRDIPVFYLDSENTEGKTMLKHFREEYAIRTVPSLLYFINGEFYQIQHHVTQAEFGSDTLGKTFDLLLATIAGQPIKNND